jgi:hypothetical protein
MQLASLHIMSGKGGDSELRCLSPSPRPSPAGRGRNFAAATAQWGIPLLSGATAGPLSQRERDGVREKTPASSSAQLHAGVPLISTGLQPGVSPCETGSRFNGFFSVRPSLSDKTVETVLITRPVHTRRKPGANEIMPRWFQFSALVVISRPTTYEHRD